MEEIDQYECGAWWTHGGPVRARLVSRPDECFNREIASLTAQLAAESKRTDDLQSEVRKFRDANISNELCIKKLWKDLAAAESRATGKPAKFKVMCIGDFTGEKIKFGNFKFVSLTHAAVVSFPTMEDAQAFAQFVHVEGTALLAAGEEAKDASVS